jgi:hypothetical protein
MDTPDRYGYVRKDYVPKPEPKSKYKSYDCHCALCIKGETCDYCDKPAKLAFIIAVTVMDPSSDIKFRACDNEEHIKRADEVCYKMENHHL